MPTKLQPDAEPRLAVQAPPRVLVLEDHALQRDMQIVALRRAGVGQIWAAEDGQGALDLLQRLDAVDVVISDLMMEGLDGIAFLTELSRLPQPPAVILASALDSSIVDSVEQMGRGLGLYMAGRLPKPATLEQMVGRLQQALERPRVDSSLQLTELASLPDLRRGLDAGEFLPHYQIKVANRDRHGIGVEALARWQHPEQGLLLPAEFEPVLDHAGLGGQLTWQLLDGIFRDVQDGARHGFLLPVSINLSGQSLRDPEFPDRLDAVVSAAGFAREMLTLEVNTGALLSDLTAAMQSCARLRMKGFGLALDDFGTGQTAFELLARLPFDELKIERQLVPGEPSSKAEILLGCLIDIGRRLGLRTVVVGVETETDLAVMQQLQPDAVQGYAIAPPLPFAELLRWWQSRSNQ